MAAITGISAISPLDRTRLHIFVCGPGIGEGIAIALPSSGWVLIDGCEASLRSGSRESIVLSLVRALAQSGENVELAVLTHPHEDHAQGFAKTVEALDPRRIMVTAKTPEGPHLLEIAERLYKDSQNAPLSQRLNEKAPVVSALRAIEAWERRFKRKVQSAVSGVSARFGAVALTVRAPDAGAHLDTILSRLAKGDRSKANQASVVLELRWGTTCVVLGGDLPTTVGSTIVPTGWRSVIAAHKHLSSHAFMKVAHHGSAEAHESTLMSGSSTPRAWAVTPFTRGRKPLPSLNDPTGLPRLLTWEGALHLTHALPSWSTTTGGFTLPISSITNRSTPPTGDPFADGAEDTTPEMAATPHDPVWAFALDDQSNLVGRWRGDRALLLTP